MIKHDKNRKTSHKIGHRGSKIGFSGINRDGFLMKITFPRSVCVRNVTLDRFLKISEKKIKKMSKISFFQNRQKIILNRSKNQNLDLLFFNFLTIFDVVTLSCLIVLA